MDLIDTHSHLSSINNVNDVIHKAQGVGIKAIVAVGEDIVSSKATIILGKKFNEYVYPAIGIHPTNSNENVLKAKEFIEKNLKICLAIGEIGLDYWYKDARKNENIRKKQRELYITQLEIAESFNKPAIVHSRGAWEEAFELGKKYGPDKIVFHWYSGPLNVLEEILDSGFLISATPAAEYSKHLIGALEKAPLEQILIETDSPVKYHGRETEPSDILLTLKALAGLKNLPEKDVAKVTTTSASKFFQI
jgi:TatD DNase family protein